MCIVSQCVLYLHVSCLSLWPVTQCVLSCRVSHWRSRYMSLNVSCLVLSCFVVAYLVTSLYFCLVACLRPSSLTSITNVSQFALSCFVLVSRSVPCLVACRVLSHGMGERGRERVTLLLQSKGCVREIWSERERETERARALARGISNLTEPNPTQPNPT